MSVTAILCSDLHLSHTPPLARSGEPSWYDAMARALGELSGLVEKYNAPVICAGDIFDRWNAPPELINFAIKHLPNMYAIPGQHDLPHHRLEDIKRSAYWTLVEAEVVGHLGWKISQGVDNVDGVYVMNLHAFPWGKEIKPLEEGSKIPHIAVCHKYVWEGQHKYDGAPNDACLSKFDERLEGYDVAVFGDNHKGFVARMKDGCRIFNCGTFMRRKADEIDYKPQVGLLMDNGSIRSHVLDTSKDKIEAIEKTAANDELDIAEFVEELSGLGGDSLDFETAVERYIESKGVRGEVKEMIAKLMEDV